MDTVAATNFMWGRYALETYPGGFPKAALAFSGQHRTKTTAVEPLLSLHLSENQRRGMLRERRAESTPPSPHRAQGHETSHPQRRQRRRRRRQCAESKEPEAEKESQSEARRRRWRRDESRRSSDVARPGGSGFMAGGPGERRGEACPDPPGRAGLTADSRDGPQGTSKYITAATAPCAVRQGPEVCTRFWVEMGVTRKL